jgi:hypothetical protein
MAATLGLIYLLLRSRIRMGKRNALIGIALSASSFSVWFYSVSVEVYAIPVFLSIICLLLLIEPKLSKRRVVILGFIHGLSVLFHIMNAMLVVPILWVLISEYRKKWVAWQHLVLYLGVAGVVTLGVYVAIGAGVRGFTHPGDLLNWILPHLTEKEQYQVSFLSLKSWVQIFVGFARSLIGAHFLFGITFVKHFASKLSPGSFLIDEVYLVRHLSGWVGYLLLGLSGLFGMACLSLLARFFYLARRGRLFLLENRLFTVFSISFVLYAWFAAYFDPTTNEFWILPIILLWTLLIIMGVCVKKTIGFDALSRRLFFAIAILLFVINYGGSMHFIRQAKNDYYLNQVTPLSGVATKNDFLVIGRYWQFGDYVKYYLDVPFVSLSSYFESEEGGHELSGLQARIQSTLSSGNHVFISPEAIEIETSTQSVFGVDPAVIESLWAPYKGRWQRRVIEGGVYYVL